MMSLTFGLFTQVSDSGPRGPFVLLPLIQEGQLSYMHSAQVKRFGGLSLLWNSVGRLFVRSDMTITVNRGRKATNQHQEHL